MNFKKANIVIITLFITILVGIMGLITTKYVINLLKISSENHKYYKAYYIGYGGLELELLKDKYHGYGFEDKITSGSNTVIKNFSGLNYYFSSKILSRSQYITNTYKSLYKTIDCSNTNNWIQLNTGDAIMIPIFYDRNDNGESPISGINYETYDISNAVLYYNGDIIVTFNEKNNQEDIGIGKSFRKLGNGNINIYTNLGSPNIDIDNKPFIIVGANTNSKICLENRPNKFTSPYTYIVSEGHYKDRTVTVKVIKNNKWAQFSTFGIY